MKRFFYNMYRNFVTMDDEGYGPEWPVVLIGVMAVFMIVRNVFSGPWLLFFDTITWGFIPVTFFVWLLVFGSSILVTGIVSHSLSFFFRREDEEARERERWFLEQVESIILQLPEEHREQYYKKIHFGIEFWDHSWRFRKRAKTSFSEIVKAKYGAR